MRQSAWMQADRAAVRALAPPVPTVDKHRNLAQSDCVLFRLQLFRLEAVVVTANRSESLAVA